MKHDTHVLSVLILQSAPILLPYLFSGEHAAKTYLAKAIASEDGQYSAKAHVLAVGNIDYLINNTSPKLQASQAEGAVLGCITMWHSDMSDDFHRATLESLSANLNQIQIRHLLQINPMLAQVFKPPQKTELCLGHVAVDKRVHGLGIGRKLIANSIQHAKQLKKQCIVLDVDANNDRAISFYHSCEFVEVNETIFEPTKQSFLRMQLSL